MTKQVSKEYRIEDFDYEKAVENSGNHRFKMIVDVAEKHRKDNRKKRGLARESVMKPLFELAE